MTNSAVFVDALYTTPRPKSKNPEKAIQDVAAATVDSVYTKVSEDLGAELTKVQAEINDVKSAMNTAQCAFERRCQKLTAKRINQALTSPSWIQ